MLPASQMPLLAPTEALVVMMQHYYNPAAAAACFLRHIKKGQKTSLAAYKTSQEWQILH